MRAMSWIRRLLPALAVAVLTLAFMPGVAPAAAGSTASPWTTRNAHTRNTLYAVSCVPVGTTGYCWAVGANGTILVSHDGGLRWSRQYSGTTSDLRGVAFTSPSAGWAVGAPVDTQLGWQLTILQTTNGGASWTPVTIIIPPGTKFNSGNSLNAVACQPNAGRCWAVGSGVAALGAPPTSPWTLVTIHGTGGTCAGTTNACLNGVAVSSDDEHFAVGGGGDIYRQFDYISPSWSPQLNLGAGYFAAVACTPTVTNFDGRCIAAGTNPTFAGGWIYYTFTSGTPWAPVTTPPTPLPRLNGVSTLPVLFPTTGGPWAWAVGDGGSILRVGVTATGLVYWVAESSPTGRTLNGVSCADTSTPTPVVCVAVGAHGTILTRA
jgi:photosystem II stability/assembly factor-like uncharacterized protein